jgi:flagellar hook-length control protein FliK
MTTMLQLMAQLPQAALDVRAPGLPVGVEVAPVGAASFDARLLQAISAQGTGAEPVIPQAESTSQTSTDQPAPPAIASILARSATKPSKTAGLGDDIASTCGTDHESKTSEDRKADADTQPTTPPIEQPKPQAVVPVPLAVPQPTVVATMAAPSPKTSITEAVPAEMPRVRQAAPDTTPSTAPVEQRAEAPQTLPIRTLLKLQTVEKTAIAVEPAAAPDAKTSTIEMPVVPAISTTSILDVTTNRGTEPGATHRALDFSNRDWATRLSNEIIAAQRNDCELAFRLTPQHLGTLEVGLTETAQGMVVELQASKEEAAQIIARDEPRLVEELRQRGVTVAEVSLRNGAGDDGRNHRNGANPAPQPPLTMNGPHGQKDQDQQQARERGRLA